MKGISLFFLKNSMGANMKKSFRNSCNGQTSTSTLPASFSDTADHGSTVVTNDDPHRKSVTLEEMILQLEMEEKLARRTILQRHDDKKVIIPRRMSCVNNSDILRSARNALNKYPRFSLDGKDAMYRSSFGTKIDLKERLVQHRRRSCSVGGESVVWCNPGVVAKLMGLEAMPIPVGKKGKMGNCKEEISIRDRNPRRRERRKEVCSSSSSSSSTNGYCMVRPVSSLEGAGRRSASWQPTHHFL